MFNKIKFIMNSYKREIEENNIQLSRVQLQETKTEKNINSINNAMNTNSIFY